MRYKITLSYAGEPFCGWQRQSSDPSVQEVVENALSTLLHSPVALTGAGRTDTGVNAAGYTAHFDAPPLSDTRMLCYKLNAILPAQIAVHGITETDEGFNARFSARQREYTYFLHRSKDPFIDRFSYLYSYPDLDVEKMNAAAAALLGTHDFSCFEKKGSDNKTSICTVTYASWQRYTPTHVAMTSFQGGDYLYFRIRADRFLRNMVRSVVGTLLEIGRGKRDVSSMAELVEGGERSMSGESVPGFALFLSGIEY